jgi:hypothetical protein
MSHGLYSSHVKDGYCHILPLQYTDYIPSAEVEHLLVNYASQLPLHTDTMYIGLLNFLYVANTSGYGMNVSGFYLKDSM